MSTTRSRVETRTTDLAVRNLDVTRPHGVTVRFVAADGGHVVHEETYPLPSGEQATVDAPLGSRTYDVAVTVDGCRTTTHRLDLETAETAVVAVGNGLVHVGDEL